MAKIDTKSEGLDLYVHVAKTFADSPWLHYGLWEPDETPTVPQLRRAQERYVERLLALIPPPPGRVLDIGGGTGEMAKLLQDRGHAVEMITPSALQAEIATEKLGADAVHLTKFEDFTGAGPYDICLFSESFQYVRLDESLALLTRILAPGGRVVIADCFRSEGYTGGKQPGGGHRFTRFLDAIARHGFELIQDHDATAAAAQTMVIDREVYRGFVAPLVEQVQDMASRQRPVLYWIGARIFRLFVSRRQRESLAARLRAENRTPEAFVKANTYRFLALARAAR